ncbi:MAG TPA: universal stress protein [Micromonosporaceae bacterium]
MANFRIVVGVDGSEGGRRALAWAVREAMPRGGAVQAVSAWRWDGLDMPPHAATHPDQERDRADRVLAQEIEALPDVDRVGVSIAAEVVEGRAADVLTAAARDADLLVLGSHGHSRVRHTVLGSVSEECIRKATCPVVVLPVPHPVLTASAEPAIRA